MKLRPRMDRLTLRLAAGVTLLVICPLSIGLFALSRHHFRHTIDTRQTAAALETRILEAALRHQMQERDRGLMAEVLHEVGAAPEVRAAMILDHDGVVRFSSRTEQVGTRIPRESTACQVCHKKAPEARQRWAIIEQSEQGEFLRSVRPIRNRPGCHRCHDPAIKLNGILMLDLSLTDVHRQLADDAVWSTVGTAVLTLLLLAGLGLLVRRLVLIRLARLRRTARQIAAGKLTARATVEGGDVIAALATDVNAMADSLSGLIGEIAEREAQMAGIMNSLEDGLLVIDGDFRVMASNRSFCRRLGDHPESLRGRDCRVAIGSAYPCHQEEDCPAARCLATGEFQRGVYQTGGPDGRIQEVHASPVLDDDGQVMHVVEVWRDITERVREEERLAEIERLSSLGVLASGFSHEVNTPLASMLTCSESILGRIADREGGNGESLLPAIRDSASIIRREALRCRKITEQFLRFARGIPPSVEPLDLRQAVASVVALAGPTAREARVRIHLEGEQSVPTVTANTEVVQHVVLNLLINAIQSCGEGGGEVSLRFAVGDDVRLQVADNGCGIPPDLQSQLFAPFRSRKPGGTGLGLFLSRSFMRRFGGDIRLVESTVGVGTCLEIVFQRVAAAAAPAEATA